MTLSHEGTRGLTHGGLRRVAAELVAASAIVLFQELALIRWLPGQVRVLAYYPNLVLISAFLGLGLGCLRAGRRSLRWAWPAVLVVLAVSARALSGIIFTQNAATEHLFLLYYDVPSDAPVVGDIRPPILALFLLSAASFVPLGQIVAERLRVFRERGRSLSGYAWDITGSLAGIAAFTILSFARTFPVIWFAAFLVVGIVFFRQRTRELVAYGAAVAMVVLVVGAAERGQQYSPYYALTLAARPAGVEILANGSLHQAPLPLLRSQTATPTQAFVRDGYHLPYADIAGPIHRALVVGAGSGNDVAVLLDHGAEHVDAVEIDPVILELGRQSHPSRPYGSPRVRTINTDARAFLNDSRDRYDVIVFGTLDSMTRLSALSTVRLDTFMYTEECLRAAREHLSPGGGLILYFAVGAPYIDLRLAGMLTRVFGEVPLAEMDHRMLFNRIYMVGPAFARRGGAERRAAAPGMLAAVQSRVELPTDDWPYLYLPSRRLGGFYLSIMLAVALIAVAGLLLASPDLVRSIGRRNIDGEMFLFGLAFLLLETRSVTAMNLAWGATWLTSAVVFFCVLVTVLLATLATPAWPVKHMPTLAALVATLLLAYALPASVVLHEGVAGRLALSVLVVGTPIFLSSVCFARVFATRAAADVAFGWNLLGAVAGGLLELLSMSLGLKALLLVASAAYLGALWVAARVQPSASTVAAA
jgi:spermine/spermidine synthase